MKIAIVGAFCAGLANAVLLAQHDKVALLDILLEKVALINQRKSPIADVDTKIYTRDLFGVDA